jgi:hypothetical protein
MAHPVTHENVEAARKPFLSNYCYPGAPTLLAIFGTESWDERQKAVGSMDLSTQPSGSISTAEGLFFRGIRNLFIFSIILAL